MHSLSVGGVAGMALIRFSALVLISTGYAAALLPSLLLHHLSIHLIHPSRGRREGSMRENRRNKRGDLRVLKDKVEQ